MLQQEGIGLIYKIRYTIRSLNIDFTGLLSGYRKSADSDKYVFANNDS